jgi:hypothetical protein
MLSNSAQSTGVFHSDNHFVAVAMSSWRVDIRGG